jgi:hypothetical protein
VGGERGTERGKGKESSMNQWGVTGRLAQKVKHLNRDEARFGMMSEDIIEPADNDPRHITNRASSLSHHDDTVVTPTQGFISR